MSAPAMVEAAGRTVTHVRHELRLRFVEVIRVARPTPRVVRVMLAGEDPAGFASPGLDDHVKLFIPPEGATLDAAPPLGAEGPVFHDAASTPARRDYTPHHLDPAGPTIQVDLALHGPGPTTDWARRTRGRSAGRRRAARVPPRGHRLRLAPPGGRRHGSAGDPPAPGRVAPSCPRTRRGSSWPRSDVPADEEDPGAPARIETRWLHRAPGARPAVAVSEVALPPGAGHA